MERARPVGIYEPRLNGIDALRAIAALAVVAFHLTFFRFILAGQPIASQFTVIDGLTRYGYLGVHMFFVISGFVITMTAIDTSPRKFIASRVARLAPLFALCSALSLIPITITGHNEPSFSLYFANLTLAPQAFGYSYIDGVYWSLRYEVIFYVVIFSLILSGRMRVLLFPLCLFWLAICVLYGLGLLPASIRRALVADYAPLFITGIGLYLFRIDPKWRNALLVVLATSISVLNELRHLKEIGDPTGSLYSPTPIVCVIALLPIVITVALNVRLMSCGKLLYWLGAMSYPLYLIHQEWGTAIIAIIPSSQILATIAAIGLVILAAIVLSVVDDMARPRVRKVLYILLSFGNASLVRHTVE